MLWMDMLLEADRFKDCYSSGKADEVETIRNATAKSSVFVDWQYGCTDIPVPSLVSLKDCGRDCVGAPWENPGNYTAHIETIAQNNLFGIMMTTWHVLCNETPQIVELARYLNLSLFPWEGSCKPFYVASSILRRVSFDGCSYEQTGWKQKQIEV